MSNSAATPTISNNPMGYAPINSLLLKLGIPMMISMLVQALYNVVDSIFVSFVSEDALSAVGLAFPAQNLMISFGVGTAVGVNALLSKSLGEKEFERASRAAGNGLFLSAVTCAAFVLFGLFGVDAFIGSQTTDPVIHQYGVEYLTICAVFSAGLFCQTMCEKLLVATGRSSLAMTSQLVGAVANIILDPIFIFTFGMGVAGAALATSLSQAVSFFLLLAGTRRGGNIRIHWRNFTPTRTNFREILRGGVPSLARQGLNSLGTVCLNIASGGYGDAAIAAMSIVSRVMMMAVSAIIGFGQGFQPICGFNYGAGLYERVRKAFWFCVRLCFGVLIVVSAAAIAFAPGIISLFLAGDAQVQQIGTLALRLQCALIPLFAFTCLANMMLQTMGIAGRATLLAMARQGLCFIPAIWLLEHAFGLLGVQLAQPAADLLSSLLAIPLTLPVLRDLRARGEGKKI